MITIIAHGILGVAYRQDIVVDNGELVEGDVKVLRDIRRDISVQYGDGTPVTGWALSPAPSGIWLSRVERAFDADYAPAYLMVSFLIPCGQQLKDDTVLNKISRAMILNHSKYINQNVIQYECDWSFLNPLAQELKGCLVSDEGIIWNYTAPTDGEVAYYDGNLSMMMREMWSGKFARFGTAFCGKGLLSPNKDYPVVDDVDEQAILDTPDTKDIIQDEPILEERDEINRDPMAKAPVGASSEEANYHESVWNNSEAFSAKAKKGRRNKVLKYVLIGVLGGIALVLMDIMISYLRGGVELISTDIIETDISIQQDMEACIPELSDQNNVVKEPWLQNQNVESKENNKRSPDCLEYDFNMIDMGFTSEKGNKFYWAFGNLTSEYEIAGFRSDQGALFYWGDTTFASTGDYGRCHYDEWYDGGGWKKSSLFGGPHPPISISGTDYDVAHVKIGDNWRLPTRKEFQDLIKNSTVTKATENGQKGYLFTSKINGNTLFFPRVDSWQGDDVGAYWSGTLVEKDIREAYYLFMTGSTAYMARLLRCDANAVRPVCDEGYSLNKSERNISNNATIASNSIDENASIENKIVISSANKLFLCLTWENVKDRGRLFYEKYEVNNPNLKHRVKSIIEWSNGVGKARYQKVYEKAKMGEEGLDDLEKLLKMYFDLDSYNNSVGEEAQSASPKFGL